MSVVVAADVEFGIFCVNLGFFPIGVKRNLEFTQTIPTPVDAFVLWHIINIFFMVTFPCDKYHMS